MPFAAFALLLVMASPAPAPEREPQPPAGEVDALIQKGLTLRREGKEREALPHLRRAYELGRTPRAAAQLGFAEQALGWWADAEVHLAEALAAADDPWVRERRTLIEESARFVARHLGSLVVESDRPGAEVLIDGRVVGRTPLGRPLRVPAGSRRVELRAAGLAPVAATVNVTAGATARVPLATQVAAPSAPAAALAAPATPPAAPPAASVVLAPPAPAAGAAEVAERPLYRRWWLWAGLGAVVIGAAAVTLAATGGPDQFPCGGGGRVCAR